MHCTKFIGVVLTFVTSYIPLFVMAPVLRDVARQWEQLGTTHKTCFVSFLLGAHRIGMVMPVCSLR